jgi:hypothetical protein
MFACGYAEPAEYTVVLRKTRRDVELTRQIMLSNELSIKGYSRVQTRIATSILSSIPPLSRIQGYQEEEEQIKSMLGKPNFETYAQRPVHPWPVLETSLAGHFKRNKMLNSPLDPWVRDTQLVRSALQVLEATTLTVDAIVNALV